MLGIPWYVAIFQSFPEALLVLIVGFALFHIKMSWRDAVLIAALSAISTYFLRQAPIVFGVHSIIAIVILVILTVLITRMEIWPATLGILGGSVTLAILQSIMVPIIFSFASIQFGDFSARPWLNILFFVPQALVMIVIYIVVLRNGWYLYDLSRKDKECA
jgi:hypothetical protein